MASDKNLVWIDLEMTGLAPERDLILEIATVITDDQLNIIAYGPELVIHHSAEAMSVMGDFVRTLHTKSGLLTRVAAATTTVAEAQEATLAFIKEHCTQGTAMLAGNSVWQDRAFLYRYMPDIINYLHYRLIDVSTVKSLARAWYPTNQAKHFKKAETHRAMTDIIESIEELRHYRYHFFVHEK
jgi:oligoribonuclease